jgi:polysaccharide biosynthesis transport protein
VDQTQELDIQRYLYIVLKRRYLFAFTAAVIITVIFIYSYNIKRLYEAKSVVSIETSFLRNVLRNMGDSISVDDKVSALSTIMKSRTLVLKVIDALGVDMQTMTPVQVEGLIKSLQDRTQVTLEFNRSSGSGADFFTVSFRDKSPQFAQAYVNTVISKYIEESMGSKKEESFGANKFLMDQIDQYKEKVDKLDAEIALLRKNTSVIYYDQLLELQKRLDDLLVQYTENHPEVIKMQSEIASLKAKFRTSQKRPLDTDSAASQSSEKINDSLAGAAKVKTQLTALGRERESSKKIYDELVAAYGKLQLSSQAEQHNKVGTFRILDPAILPIKPVSAKRIQIMLLGIVGGIAGAFGLLVAIDYFDKSLKNVDTLRRFGYPVLAIIPHIQDSAELFRARIKNIVFYILSGLFVVLVCVAMGRELLIMP